jgi:hypothetical protein
MWAECYNILQTGLIFLDTVELGPLDSYKDMIQKYATAYPSLWHLVFQADSRMRHEHMERIRRRGAEAHSKDPSHPYDDANPWKWVWAEAVEDAKFWKRELEDPAFFVLNRLKTLGDVVAGDAAISGGEPRGTKRRAEDDLHHQSGATDALSIPGAERAPPAREPKKPKKIKDTEDKSSISGGKYTHNRRGKSICSGYNAGTCHQQEQGICSKDQSSAHQCHFCLQQHPAGQCTKVLASSKPKGKGKGKGKR